MSALLNSLKQYQFAQWERIVIKFIMITFPTMVLLDTLCM